MVIHRIWLSPLDAAHDVFRLATLEGPLPMAAGCGLWCRTAIDEPDGTTFMAAAIFLGDPDGCGVFPTPFILTNGSRSPTSAC